MSTEELIELMRRQIAGYIGADPSEVDANAEFMNCGIDSINALLLIDEIEKKVGVEINPLLFWEYPTIRTFAERVIAQKYPERAS